MSAETRTHPCASTRPPPVGTARSEDPGLSVAREAAEAVPTESVRS